MKALGKSETPYVVVGISDTNQATTYSRCDADDAAAHLAYLRMMPRMSTFLFRNGELLRPQDDADVRDLVESIEKKPLASSEPPKRRSVKTRHS